MARLPLSPRTTALYSSSKKNKNKSAAFARSPSMPSGGHVRSVRSRYLENVAARDVGPNVNPTNSNDPIKNTLSDRRSNEYVRKSGEQQEEQCEEDELLHLAKLGQLAALQQRSGGRFVPNKDSPTWKSLQQQHSRTTTFASNGVRRGGRESLITASRQQFPGAEEEDDNVAPASGSHVTSVGTDKSLASFTSSTSTIKKDNGSSGTTKIVEECHSSDSVVTTATSDSSSIGKLAMMSISTAISSSSSSSNSSISLLGSRVKKNQMSLGSYVESRQGEQQGGQKRTTGISNTASSITSASSGHSSKSMSNKRHQPTTTTTTSTSGKSTQLQVLYDTQNIISALCTSSSSGDSTSSSLIYSVEDTVKSLGSGTAEMNAGLKLLLSNDLSEEEEGEENGEDDGRKQEKVVMTDVMSTIMAIDGILDDEPVDEEEEEETKQDDDDDDDDADPEAMNLVATTLAECRLLLEMSPPPTPIAGGNGGSNGGGTFSVKNVQPMPSVFRAEEEARSETQDEDEQEHRGDCKLPHHSKQSGQKPSTGVAGPSHDSQSQQEPPQHSQHAQSQPKPKQQTLGHHSPLPSKPAAAAAAAAATVDQPSSRSNEGSSGNTSLAGSHSLAGHSLAGTHSIASMASQLTSISKFLTCPTCSCEFSEEGEGNQPLHSFACDHIVCRRCVFSNHHRNNEANDARTTTAMAACPECGVEGAFNVRRPVVSRAYLGLVKKMKMEMSVIGGQGGGTDQFSQHSARHKSEVDKREQPVVQSGGDNSAVPSQICVPSPKNHRNADAAGMAATATDAYGRETRIEDEQREGAASDDVSHMTESVAASPAEPSTPVSRAEHRFRQRKEKLAQSLEKVNRILERNRRMAEEQQASCRSANNEQEGTGSSSPSNRKAGSRVQLFQMIAEDDESESEDDDISAVPEMKIDHAANGDIGDKQSGRTNEMAAAGNEEDCNAIGEKEGKSITGNDDAANIVEGRTETFQKQNATKSRLRRELRVDTGVQKIQASSDVQEQQSRDRAEEEDASTIVSRGDIMAESDDDESRGYSLPSEVASTSINKGAVKVQTRATSSNLDDLKEDLFASRPSPFTDSSAAPITTMASNSNNEAIADIFRVDKSSRREDATAMDAPRLIEFGACAIAASGSSDGGSSLTSAKDDGAGTLFLLPENRTADNANKVAYCEQHNRQNQGGGKLPMTVTMIRDAYRINNIIKGGGRGGSVHQLDARQKQRGHHNRANNDIDPQRQHREQKQKCPQFLPSLNYSSMHEESQKNQVAGLILSDGDDGGDDFPRSPMWGGFGGMQTRASSKRGGSLSRSNNAGNANNAFRQMDLQEEQENVGAGGNEQRPRRRQQQHQHEMWQKKKKQQQREQPKRNEEEKGGPTYVFSVPSCSFSPSNSSTLDGDDLQYLGVVGGGGMGAGGGTSALVTHRPRGFRKKILNTFRGVNKNKKKFRKSLA